MEEWKVLQSALLKNLKITLSEVALITLRDAARIMPALHLTSN